MGSSFTIIIIKKASRIAGSLYPEPGSNRHGLLHWCLRPARLPIPPSGPFCHQAFAIRAFDDAKLMGIFYFSKFFSTLVCQNMSFYIFRHRILRIWTENPVGNPLHRLHRILHCYRLIRHFKDRKIVDIIAVCHYPICSHHLGKYLHCIRL